MQEDAQNCPCESGLPYTKCCLKYHQGQSSAPTAEALMRSRFSAYVLCEIDYLVKTTLPAKQKGNLRAAYQSTHDSIRWIGLEVVNTWLGEAKDKIGKVEFRAEYEQNGKRFTHHELSRFRKSANQWYYVDGQVENIQK